MRTTRPCTRTVLVFLAAAALALSMTACGCSRTEPAEGTSASETTAAGDSAQSIEVGGTLATYVLHIPADLPPNAPAMLVFHGRGRSGAQMAAESGLNAVADANHVVVAYPDNFTEFHPAARARSAADNVALVSALIAKLAAGQHIDTTRVFAVGVSTGGAYTQMLGCDAADKFAAIAPTLSGMPASYAHSCNPARPLAVFALHGTADPIVPYGGGPITGHGPDAAEVLSVPDTIALWSAKNACPAPPPPTALPDKVNDGTHITITTSGPCRDNTRVQLVTVEGGGHTWPGTTPNLPEKVIGKTSQNLNTAQAIWDFFAAQHP
jgi:polyhydroxybutyrate depolymerase